MKPAKENKQLFIGHCREAPLPLPWPPAFDPAVMLLLDGGRTFAAPPVAFFIACSYSQLSYCAFDRICYPAPSPPLAAAELISEALITPPTAACPPTLASIELLRLICY